MRIPRNTAHRRRPFEAAALLSPNAPAPQGILTHLVIGKVLAPRGVHGEIKVLPESADPERFRVLQQVYLGDERVRFEVTRARLHQGIAFLQLQGIETPEAVEPWRGATVYVAAEDAVPLEADEYYYYQIVGLAVSTLEGEALGRVTEVLATGANDVYIVRGESGEILLPAIKDVIVRVDLVAGSMLVRLPEGLR
jgi:16S rRNA processing protein RimM